MRVVTVGAVLALAAAPAPAGTGAGDRFLREVLPNGAVIVVAEARAAPAVAIALLVRGGRGLDDATRPAGTRLLTDAWLRGSARFPAGAGVTALSRVGGTLAAAADTDACWMTAEVRAAHVGLALDVVLDGVGAPECAEAALAGARERVVAEAGRAAADARSTAWDALRAACFGAHPAGLPTPGPADAVAASDAAAVRALAARCAGAAGLVCVVAGDVDGPMVLATLRERLAARPAGVPPPAPPAPVPAPALQEETRVRKTATPALALGIVVPGGRHPDAPACAVLGRMLDTRVHSAAVVRHRIAATARGGYLPSADVGLLWIEVIPTHTEQLRACETLATRILGDCRELEPTAEEFDRVRDGIATADLFGDESALDRALRFAKAEVHGGPRYAASWRHRVRRLTATEVRRVAERYLVRRGLVVLRVVPEGATPPPAEPDAPLENARGRLPDRQRLPAAELQRVTYATEAAARMPDEPRPSPGEGPGEPASPGGAPLATVLPNGCRLVVRPDRSLPVVACGIFVPAGTVAEAPAPPGVAALLLRTLFRGSGSMSRPGMEAAVERFGGGLELAVRPDWAGAILAGPAEDLPRMINLLASAVSDPVLDSAEWETVRAELVTGARRRGESASAAASDRCRRLVLGGHAAGRPAEGTVEGLRAADRAHGFALLHRGWRPDRATCVVVGDAAPHVVLAEVSRAFAGWWAAPHVAEPAARPDPAAGAVADGAPAGASAILGVPGFAYGTPEHAPASLLAWILGWRIHRDLVEARGLATRGGAYTETLRERGALFAFAEAAPARVGEVQAALRALVASMRAAAPSPDEVRDTREWLLGTLLLARQRRAARVSALGDAMLRAGSPEADERWFAGLAAATPEQLLALARRLPDPAAWTAVMVGAPAEGR